jgi:hypothetical protein
VRISRLSQRERNSVPAGQVIPQLTVPTGYEDSVSFDREDVGMKVEVSLISLLQDTKLASRHLLRRWGPHMGLAGQCGFQRPALRAPRQVGSDDAEGPGATIPLVRAGARRLRTLRQGGFGGGGYDRLQPGTGGGGEFPGFGDVGAGSRDSQGVGGLYD